MESLAAALVKSTIDFQSNLAMPLICLGIMIVLASLRDSYLSRYISGAII